MTEVRPSHVVRRRISQAHVFHSIRHALLHSFSWLCPRLSLIIWQEVPSGIRNICCGLRSIAMKLTFAVLALLQISHALHIKQAVHNAVLQQLRRTAQDTSTDFANLPTTGDPIPTKPKKPLPWWKLPNTDNGEMNAISWSQFLPLDSDVDSDDASSSASTNIGIGAGNNVCPVNQCKSSGALGKYYCGANARCLNSYCQCNFGWKPASGVPTSRGWSGLEALTVWVDDHSSGCTERCDSLPCSDVAQVPGCFDQHIAQADKDEGKDQSQEDEGNLETNSLHLGAIKAPGADTGIGV